ncbi:uncharacterized protein VTP21DRAFT_6943 [Calcarisporiella thermophila]|uniref:uncharacterized protein n=1 Tax=Calcarisporiella thermophila TaxID=911321 RepID=UPI0037432FFB
MVKLFSTTLSLTALFLFTNALPVPLEIDGIPLDKTVDSLTNGALNTVFDTVKHTAGIDLGNHQDEPLLRRDITLGKPEEEDDDDDEEDLLDINLPLIHIKRAPAPDLLGGTLGKLGSNGGQIGSNIGKAAAETAGQVLGESLASSSNIPSEQGSELGKLIGAKMGEVFGSTLGNAVQGLPQGILSNILSNPSVIPSSVVSGQTTRAQAAAAKAGKEVVTSFAKENNIDPATLNEFGSEITNAVNKQLGGLITEAMSII